MPREFTEIADDLRFDGGLRDFYIRGTNYGDWNVALRSIRSSRGVGCFTVDGESRELPPSFEAVEQLRPKANPCWSTLVAGARVNCHFFCEEEIELDFRPEDYRTPERWSKLCAFFQEIVDAVGKPGIVTLENRQEALIERFEPGIKVERGA